MAEKTLGYSIEVRGTEATIKKQADLKRAIIDTSVSIKNLKEATKDNIAAQKAAAGTLATLETQLKVQRQQYNSVTKEIIHNSQVVEHAAGSYNALVQENNNLVKSLHALPGGVERNSVVLRGLKERIFENTEKLKDFDAATNRHFRNVGNYTGGILQATRGLKGFAEIGNVAARALGIDTAALQGAIQAGRGFIQVGKSLAAIKGASIAATQGETAATVQLTIVQRILNAVRNASAGTIGIAIAAVAVLAAGISILISRTQNAKAAEEARSRAMDGTIIKSKELRDAYNDHLITVHEVENAYRVLNGEMTEFEATIDDIKTKYNLTLSEIKKETEAKLIESGGFWQEFWHRLKTGERGARSDIQKIAEEGNDKIKKTELDRASDLSKANLDQKKKEKEAANRKVEEDEADADREADKKKERQKREAKEIEDEIKKNNQTIFELNRANVESVIKLQEDSTEKSIELFANASDNEIADLRSKIIRKKKLREDEIAFNEAINRRILQLEKDKFAGIDKLAAEGDAKELQQKIKGIKTLEALDIAHVGLTEQTEKEKAQKILDIRIKAAQDQLELLRASGKAEQEEVKLQIAQLELSIAEATKKKEEIPGESRLAQMIGLDEASSKLLADQAVALADNIADSIFTVKKQQLDRELDINLRALNTQEEMEMAKIDDRAKRGLISQEAADIQRENLAAKFEKKKLALEKEAFERNKKMQLKQIAIDLAMQLMKIAIMAAANPLNAVTAGGAGAVQYGILAAAAVLNAAVQGAVVASQKFKRGGIVQGEGTETSDSVLVRASKNEAIMNANSTRLFRPWLSAMNVAGGGRAFAEGGIPLPSGLSTASSIMSSAAMNMEQFAEIIQSKIDNIKVSIVEKEMTGAQKKAHVFETQNEF